MPGKPGTVARTPVIRFVVRRDAIGIITQQHLAYIASLRVHSFSLASHIVTHYAAEALLLHQLPSNVRFGAILQ